MYVRCITNLKLLLFISLFLTEILTPLCIVYNIVVLDCDYELHVQLNDVTMASKRGVLRKVEKNVSADRPYDEALVL